MATQSSTKTLASEPAGILKVSYFNDHAIDRFHVGERVDGFALSHIWINGQPAHCLKGFKAEIINNDAFVFKIEKINIGGKELFLTLEAQERVSLKVHYQNQEYTLNVSLKLTVEGLKRQLQRQFSLGNFKILKKDGDPLNELSVLINIPIDTLSPLFIQCIEDEYAKMDKEHEGKKPLEGGLKTAFTSFNNEIRLPFDDSAPHWHGVIKGFNLTGRCKKEGCLANNDSICMFKDLGLGMFNIEKVSAVACCPMGHSESIEVTGCIFWDCKYTITGYRSDKTHFPKREGVVGKETALAFPGGSNSVDWNHLQIVTEDNSPLEVNPDSQSSVRPEKEFQEDTYHDSPFPTDCTLS